MQRLPVQHGQETATDLRKRLLLLGARNGNLVQALLDRVLLTLQLLQVQMWEVRRNKQGNKSPLSTSYLSSLTLRSPLVFSMAARSSLASRSRFLSRASDHITVVGMDKKQSKTQNKKKTHLEASTWRWASRKRSRASPALRSAARTAVCFESRESVARVILRSSDALEGTQRG